MDQAEVRYRTQFTALDVLLILHADHEQNCSTNAMRAVGSSRVDPYSAAAAAVAALYGPLHGRANQECLEFLEKCGTDDPDAVEAFVHEGNIVLVPNAETCARGSLASCDPVAMASSASGSKVNVPCDQANS